MLYTKKAVACIAFATLCSVVPYFLLYGMIHPLVTEGTLLWSNVLLLITGTALCLDLNIDSGRESNYQPFAIYKEQVLKLLADTNMTQSKKEDLIVALFAYVQGLTTLATMENVHYAYKWEDKLTDLIGIFSCEF